MARQSALHRLRRGLLRVSLATIGGCVCYSLWLAAFLLAGRGEGSGVFMTLWSVAPVVTASGFAAGAALAEMGRGSDGGTFLAILPWPLIGCTIGAAVVWLVGPMLIVLGMLGAGAASVILRELHRSRRDRSHERSHA